MTIKNHPPPPPLVNAPPPLTRSRRNLPIHSRSAKFGEVAGRTAADCAVVCCCCPCGLVSLLLCAVFKLPVGLCRRAIVRRRRRRRLKKKAAARGLLVVGPSDDDVGMTLGVPVVESVEVAAMEKEMWEKFYGTGFWRTQSQREC